MIFEDLLKLKLIFKFYLNQFYIGGLDHFYVKLSNFTL